MVKTAEETQPIISVNVSNSASEMVICAVLTEGGGHECSRQRPIDKLHVLAEAKITGEYWHCDKRKDKSTDSPAFPFQLLIKRSLGPC